MKACRTVRVELIEGKFIGAGQLRERSPKRVSLLT
jgi:hypothetical protein